MKKIILIVICVCFSFFLVGCEGQTEVRSAHISDMTTALSTKYSIKVVLEKDDRVDLKNVALQLKSSEENQFLKFGEENHQGYTLLLPNKDYWYNLTYLISQTNGTKEEGGYEVYEDYGTKVFNFSTKNDVDMTFRVVVGQTKTNEQTGEEILVLSEPISDEVVIEMKADKEE